MYTEHAPRWQQFHVAQDQPCNKFTTKQHFTFAMFGAPTADTLDPSTIRDAKCCIFSSDFFVSRAGHCITNVVRHSLTQCSFVVFSSVALTQRNGCKGAHKVIDLKQFWVWMDEALTPLPIVRTFVCLSWFVLFHLSLKLCHRLFVFNFFLGLFCHRYLRSVSFSACLALVLVFRVSVYPSFLGRQSVVWFLVIFCLVLSKSNKSLCGASSFASIWSIGQSLAQSRLLLHLVQTLWYCPILV